MISIMFLILLASFAAIGDVEWLKAFVQAIKDKKGWGWPAISAGISLVAALAAALIWPAIVHDSPVALSFLLLWPLLFMLTLGTIQMGYSLVVKTFLDLLGGLAARMSAQASAISTDTALKTPKPFSP
jgi:hypothetical protein